MIIKIISGSQCGADIGALIAAKAKGIETGGWIPKGFKTQDGPKPEYKELYNIQEHESDKYPPRTFLNVKESDGTIRIATNFNSAGEKCTLKAIQQYNKPYFDVKVEDVNRFFLPLEYHPKSAVEWIVKNNIKILNVAGNSEKTSPGIQKFAERYILKLIELLDENK